MKFEDTNAYKCRYGDVAATVWGDWNIIWERSCADFQGSASFLAEKDGAYCFYEWSYGSCSWCDTWESENKSDADIANEMKSTAMWMSGRQALDKWIAMLVSTGDSKAEIAKVLT